MTETNNNREEPIRRIADLTDEEVKALEAIINDRLWWDEALKRAKKVGMIAGGIFAGLALLATWWPWITNMVQFFIKDVPTG